MKRATATNVISGTMKRCLDTMPLGVRLGATLGLTCALVAMIATSLLYAAEKRKVIDRTQEGVLQSLQVQLGAIDASTNQAIQAARSIIARQKLYGERVDPDLKRALVAILETTPEDVIYDAYMVYEHHRIPSGQRYDVTVSRDSLPGVVQTDESYDDEAMEWFTGPRDSGGLYFSEPYYDAGSVNASMVSITLPFLGADGRFHGVGGVDVVLDRIQQAVGKAQISIAGARRQASQPFLISKSGALISHPNSALLPSETSEGKNVKQLPSGRLIQGGQGSGRFVEGGKAYWAYWITSPLTGWTLATVEPESLVLEPVVLLRNQLAVFALCLVGAVVAVILVAAKRATRPLAELTGMASALAAGDARCEPLATRKDEVGSVCAAFSQIVSAMRQQAGIADRIAQGDLATQVPIRSEHDLLGHALASMRDQLRASLAQIAELANHTQDTGTALRALAAESLNRTESMQRGLASVGQASSESADIAQQLASGAEQLAQGANAMTATAEDLAASIARVHEASSLQADAAQSALSTGQEGRARVAGVLDAVQDTESELALAQEAVGALHDRQKQIAAMVDAIEDIAEQTTLLALNAAIEAARAGAEGRGFSVVADEVGALAARAGAAARDTRSLIGQEREGVERVLSAIAAVEARVAAGKQAGVEADDAFHRIDDSVKELARLAEDNRAQVLSMEESAQRLESVIAHIAAVSEESSAATQTVSAGIQETVASTHLIQGEVDEVVGVARSLNERADRMAEVAERLHGVLAKFQFEEDGYRAAA